MDLTGNREIGESNGSHPLECEDLACYQWSSFPVDHKLANFEIALAALTASIVDSTTHPILQRSYSFSPNDFECLFVCLCGFVANTALLNFSLFELFVDGTVAIEILSGIDLDILFYLRLGALDYP